MTGVKGPVQWGGGGGEHEIVVEVVITTESFLPVKSESGWKEVPLSSKCTPYPNALLYLVRGPGRALMSLIGSTSRCCLWWRSRSPLSRKHSSRG